jgi:eukaryotic-like serine/threonine-protein kinase
MSTDERWRQVEALYHAALQRSPAERAPFLRKACPDDESIWREVESLLAQPASDIGFLQVPALAVAARVIPSQSVASLAASQTVGPYTIVGLLGVGGMGEVYRASDRELGREVAIKMLPQAFLNDADRLARFEREKRVLAALNHPNIAAIYTVEPVETGRALVLELVEGPTLADRLARGPLALAEALGIATQIADALEAAHEKSIVHRDLKPANIKLRPDGTVKVLDFGLAKAVANGGTSFAPTKLATTSLDGTGDRIIGTPAYMSPEQARGQMVDKRTDVWAFGCVLFEMLTGRVAFRGATVTDTLAAIVERDPSWSTLPASTPSAIQRLLRRCLEKDAKRRLHDIADARIEIEEALSRPVVAPEPRRSRQVLMRSIWSIGLVAAGGLLAAGAWVAARSGSSEPPIYHQITFRRGSLEGARFAPDGETVLYSANWDGQPVRLFSSRINNAEPSELSFDNSTLLAVSSNGQMAIRLGETPLTPGTLAVVPITGTQKPRELVADAFDADWSPRGDTLVVTRVVDGRFRLESPPGTVLYDPGQTILSPHFSPKGDAIAFIELLGGNPGSGLAGGARIAVSDLAGHVKVLSEGWGEAFSLAWSPDGGEIWFSAREAASQSGGLALHAVTLSGRHRVVARMPGILFLRQIWPDGRVLLERADWPVTMMCRAPAAVGEQNLSWMDFSAAKEMSADGRSVVFDESGIAGGSRGTAYMRKLDGSPAVRLDEGQALALSPDGGSVLTFLRDVRDQLRIVPTGPGQIRVLHAAGMSYVTARWFPDGQHVLVSAQEPTHTPSLFVQGIDGGSPRRLLDDAVDGAVSPDGRTVATIDREGMVVLTPTDGGRRRLVQGPRGARMLRWTDTNRYVFLQADNLFPAKILKFDLETGRAEAWLTLGPADMAGVRRNNGYIALSADGRSYCYSYIRFLSTLFVVEGLK